VTGSKGPEPARLRDESLSTRQTSVSEGHLRRVEEFGADVVLLVRGEVGPCTVIKDRGLHIIQCLFHRANAFARAGE
jgi:hypothetical protein